MLMTAVQFKNPDIILRFDANTYKPAKEKKGNLFRQLAQIQYHQ